MNKILSIAVVLFTIGMLISCNDDDEGVSGFSIDKDEITVGSEGGTDVVTVSSGVGWTASASVPWITVSPANGVGSAECSIVIDTTLVVGMREATVTFLPVGLPQREISVYQTGYGNIISLEEKELTIPASAAYDDRYFELKVTSNVEFKVGIEYSEPADGSEVTEWLTAPNVDLTLDRGARPRTTTLRFDWKINTKWEERGAKIVFTPTGKDEGAELVEEAVLTLNQEPALEITDDRAGDSLAIISIREQLTMLGSQDINEKLQNWWGVVVWEKNDKDLPKDENGNIITEAIGRVREVNFYIFDTKEIPQEIKYLKYLETLSFYGNANAFLKNIDMPSEICELKYLKNLQLGSIGLITVAKEINQLTNLVSLDFSSNNYDHIPDEICKENLPNLRVLNLLGNRRWVVVNLSTADLSSYEGGIGMHINMDKDAAAAGVRRLFLWEELEELDLNYNYLEGTLPTFEVGTTVDGQVMTPFIKGKDFVALGDTISWLWTEEGQKVPRILPNCRSLKINLNFLTGDAPLWIMYHPYLIDWVPDTFIFNQNEFGYDSNNKLVKFDNQPSSYNYFYEVYPLYEAKYTYDDEWWDE